MVFLGLVLGPLTANSGEYQMGAVIHSKDFDKLKELVGVWEGTTDMGKGMVANSKPPTNLPQPEPPSLSGSLSDFLMRWSLFIMIATGN